MQTAFQTRDIKNPSRRQRFAGRQPKGLNIHITDNDLRYFQALEDHGLLPSHYLKRFADHWTSGWAERLMNVYHETLYLDRPDGQDLSRYANCQYAVYQLSREGRALITQRQLADGPSGQFPHQLMISTILASIALSLPSAYSFVTQERILTRAQKPLAVQTSHGLVIPDGLFGICHPDGGFQFFALEADRATEVMVPTKKRHTDITKKTKGYKEILSFKRYKSHWGLPNVRIMTVTSAPQRMANMVQMVDDDRFIFQCEPYFSRHWRIPPIMAELVAEPYACNSGPYNILDY